MPSTSPETLRLFLHDCVASYEELQTLLFLNESASRAWSSGQLAVLLSLPQEAVHDALTKLVKVGLASAERPEDGYRYAPRDKANARLVAELRRAYLEEPLSVVQMMSGNAVERARDSALRLAESLQREKRGK